MNILDQDSLKTGENDRLKLNDRFQVELLQTLPSSGQWDMNTELEFIDFRINGDKAYHAFAGWFAFTILPIEYYLNNGTILNNARFISFTKDVISLEIIGDYIESVFRNGEFDEVFVRNHIETGIVDKFTHISPDRFNFTLSYTKDDSSVDINGNSQKEDESKLSFFKLGSTISILGLAILIRSKKHSD
ncbi:MAG: hypothetical protein ACXAD7_20160 [Candidatus Kariarchaeaceae archaeon]